MKLVYINLDRAPDRRRWMEAQASALRLTLERIPAVDGHRLDKQQIATVTDMPRSAVTLGAIGCFLSHRKAWRAAAISSASHTVILEDDIHFSTSSHHFLHSACWIPADADIVRLERTKRSCYASASAARAPDERRLHRLRGKDTGTGAYIVSRDCAKRLEQHFSRIDRDFDQILFGGWSDLFKATRTYKLFPALCVQDIVASAVGTTSMGFETHVERPATAQRRDDSSKVAGVGPVHSVKNALRKAAVEFGLPVTVTMTVMYR